MSKRFNKENYTLHFNLYFKQPWIQRKEEAFAHLLDVCCNDEERNLIVSLLDKFIYLDDKNRNELVSAAASHIMGAWKFDPSKTTISAATFEYESDSAQALLWFLDSKLAELGWGPTRTINNINKIYGNISTRPNLIIFDDFCGSGRTLRNRVLDCLQKIETLPDKKKPAAPINVKVLTLVAGEHAKRVVESTGVEMFSAHWYKRGISGYLTGRALRRARRRMLRLEQLLDQKASEHPFPSFGFGGAEATYCVDGGRAPNSVFPIFWWSRLAAGRERPTILTRIDDWVS